MESFGVPENDIARWAGIASAIFSICQAFTGLLWGAASDKYGRKPIILLGLFNTMWTMLLWGLSTNLPMALAARALQGLGNGNVGIGTSTPNGQLQFSNTIANRKIVLYLKFEVRKSYYLIFYNYSL